MLFADVAQWQSNGFVNRRLRVRLSPSAFLKTNPKHALRLGMIAEAKISGDRQLDLMTVPGDAIVHDPQGASVIFVYFPDQGRVYSKRVEVGTVYGTEVEIRSGLAGTEQLVLAGQGKLRDGSTVTMVEAK